MYYYKIKDKYGFSFNYYKNLTTTSLEEVKNSKQLYFLYKMKPLESRRSFCVSDPSLLFQERESIDILNKKYNANYDIDDWLLQKIIRREIIAINTNYPNWYDVLSYKTPDKWKVNILAMGDVGSTLLIGLRLLGGDIIKEIGIFDRTYNKAKRWELEMNQVKSAFNHNYPDVNIIQKEELFDCDMFVFCASKSVPSIGSNIKDIRMAQFESNSKIIKEYSQMAREKNFKGIFAVVSDPVDLLSKRVFLESNKNDNNDYDFKGLAPEQIRGYGLGVMNARACYYAKKDNKFNHFLKEGRAYGPHGEGLVIADSITNYNDELSVELTNKTKKANHTIRDLGYKPFIAPALSSGSLSIIDTLKGNWHYSATFVGGVYMGAKNRLLNSGTEIENIELDKTLFNRIKKSYENLGDIL